MTRRSLAWLVLLATAFLVVQAILASRFLEDADDTIMQFTWVEAVIYAIAAFVVLRDKGTDAKASRRAVAGILVVGTILRGMLIFIDPISTDINRYIWDGRVQAAGINPYLYVPADPHLEALRDDEIYTEINRRDYAPTIYPPLAQIVFFLVTRVSETVPAMKAAMVFFEGIGLWAVLRLMAARNIPSGRILLFAWHPLPIWEFAGSGHVDAIALACVCLALLAAESRRPILAGMALGGATLVKFFPVVVAPALYRRWDWRLPLAGFLTIVVLYLPYLGAGRKIFGFLSGYSAEEGLSDGSGFYPIVLLRQLVPLVPHAMVALYIPFAALVLAALGLFVLFRRANGETGADLAGAFLLASAFIVLTSPHFPWYLTLLVPFLCFIPSWPVIWLTGSATLMYIAGWPPDFWGGSFLYLPFFALLALDVTLRRHRTKDRDHGRAIPL